MKSSRIRLLVLLLALAVGIVACAPAAQAAETPLVVGVRTTS